MDVRVSRMTAFKSMAPAAAPLQSKVYSPDTQLLSIPIYVFAKAGQVKIIHGTTMYNLSNVNSYKLGFWYKNKDGNLIVNPDVMHVI